MEAPLSFISAGCAVIMLLANLYILIRGNAKQEAEVKAFFKKELDELRLETTHNLASINQDVVTSQNAAMVTFGETIAAIREQVSKNALHTEQTFLRREDFYEHNRRGEKQLEMIDRKIDDRFNRVEKRLEDLSR